MPAQMKKILNEYSDVKDDLTVAFETLDTAVTIAYAKASAPSADGDDENLTLKTQSEIILAAIDKVSPTLDKVGRMHIKVAPVIRFCDRVLVIEEAKEMEKR